MEHIACGTERSCWSTEPHMYTYRKPPKPHVIKAIENLSMSGALAPDRTSAHCPGALSFSLCVYLKAAHQIFTSCHPVLHTTTHQHISSCTGKLNVWKQTLKYFSSCCQIGGGVPGVISCLGPGEPVQFTPGVLYLLEEHVWIWSSQETCGRQTRHLQDN